VCLEISLAFWREDAGGPLPLLAPSAVTACILWDLIMNGDEDSLVPALLSSCFLLPLAKDQSLSQQL
jgi:hypothetical protein